jgi:uncharacterized membrane protein YkvA (DUF1232 family)
MPAVRRACTFPDILPVIGIADDLVLVPLAIHWLLNRLPPGIDYPAAKPQE